jgi:hypothetical protein
MLVLGGDGGGRVGVQARCYDMSSDPKASEFACYTFRFGTYHEMVGYRRCFIYSSNLGRMI